MQNPYYELFKTQKYNQFVVGNTDYKTRLKKLNKLQNAVQNTYKNAIRAALYTDLKKPKTEVDLTEIYPVVSAIKFAKKHLKYWVKNQNVTTPLSLVGSSSWIRYEPKGVCLIIAPWNFPLNLTFQPLVWAIAAGNTVIIKPSEFTPNTSKLMSKIVKELFNEAEIALVEGGIEASQSLLELPFNHIFFTGSPAVGKIVMKAAAEQLTSVTLELGGKSPVIIDDTANIPLAAKKIAWGKFVNNGQVCIAPDYVLVKTAVKLKFITALQTALTAFYAENPLHSKSYSRIVNKKHFNRLISHLENAKQHNATIAIGGNFNEPENYIAPTIISDLPDAATLWHDEIFGPILLLKTYDTIEEAVAYINSKEKPLALYIYSKNNNNINTILKNTRAGSTCINHNILQYSNQYLPFGGSNNSGIGKSHGFYGFQEFSNARSVLKQYTKSPVEILFPPYTKLKEKLVNFMLKWF